jgi:hypothetical protein
MCQAHNIDVEDESESESQLEVENEPPEDESEEDTEIIRSKWALDGCASFDQIVARLGSLIEHYRRLKADGWELVNPIDDDYGFIRQARPRGSLPGVNDFWRSDDISDGNTE